MRIAMRWMVVAAGLMASHGLMAQAPAGATGQCKDGTYSMSASKSGACRGHQGVKEWFAAGAAPANASPKGAAPKTAAPAAASPSAMPAPTAAQGAPRSMPAPTPSAAPMASRPAPASSSAPAPAAKSAAKSAAPPMQQAAGGGPGMVWVNTSTKVYHCPGTRYYGTTKDGKYMSEAEAKGMGAKADHGKACSN